MKSKINPNGGTMNFSCLYFYPRHLRHNLGRQACSSHFEEFQIGQSPIFRGCQIFVAFHLVSYANFLTFLGWEDPVRAILGIIQFFYLNSNMNLIIISHSGGSRLGHRASGTRSKPPNLNENGQKPHSPRLRSRSKFCPNPPLSRNA